MLALLASVVSTLIAIAFPQPSTELAKFTVWTLVWVFAQSLLVTFAGLLLGCVGQFAGERVARTFAWLGACLVIALPVLMLVDGIAFRWMGQRFLSAAMWRLITELSPGLIPHVSAGMITTGIGVVFMLIVITVGLPWASRSIAITWEERRPDSRPLVLYLLVGGIVAIGTMPSWWNLRGTRTQMALHSSQHPLCVLRTLPHQSVGKQIKPRDQVVLLANDPIVESIENRERALRLVSVSPIEDLPDVVIVVIESFRAEVVTDEVMPNLSALADKGIHCEQHFSGGNATNHGVFSLLNGLEAIWFERPVRFSPILNRLLHQAGYEIGFFAGHDQWEEFYMDGFLSDEHFDVFDIAPANELASDRKATQSAGQFLSRAGEYPSENDKPRCAVLYLYATHAIYRSYSEDQVFQPAADERFIYPYAESARPEVWNRYRNSARTVDRFLKSIIRDDRVILVTGDHGEAFLEDGTIGHGTRLSQVQNMTPAVVYSPGIQPQKIQHATMHADLLPTLLGALNLSYQNELDGVDLTSEDEQALVDRSFVTRNYLDHDVALIGSWTTDREDVFGYRAHVSLSAPTMELLNAIDVQGNECQVGKVEMQQCFDEWRLERFSIRPEDE